MNDLRLLSAAARRFSHDLANPLAALQTLVGIGETDPLMEQAVEELAARLSLFRLLCGGDPDDPSPDLEMLVRERLRQRDIALASTIGVDGPGRERRAGFSLALAAGQYLAGPAEVRLEAGPLVSARGRARGIGPALPEALAGGRPGDPADFFASFAAALAGPFAFQPVEGGFIFSRSG